METQKIVGLRDVRLHWCTNEHATPASPFDTEFEMHFAVSEPGDAKYATLL
jgi:hypothetical protein